MYGIRGVSCSNSTINQSRYLASGKICRLSSAEILALRCAYVCMMCANVGSELNVDVHTPAEQSYCLRADRTGRVYPRSGGGGGGGGGDL